MKKFFSTLFVLLYSFSSIGSVFAIEWDEIVADTPASGGIEVQREWYVKDYAEILSDETEAEITSMVEEIVASEIGALAVVTVPNLDGGEANQRAVELGRAWGIGHAERDDGVLFLTSVEDRVTYIATGYDVEPYIPDIIAFNITEYTVVPYFREGDYDSGILEGTKEIRKRLLEMEPLTAEEIAEMSEGGGVGLSWVFGIIFFLSFVFPWLAAVFARSKAWWPGGVVGGGVGVALASWFQTSLGIAISLALFGLLFDYLASTNFKKGKSKWYTGGGKGGWGGGSSSGGWGSSSGGSSFGGFSGGSFGGGGGGSSW